VILETTIAAGLIAGGGSYTEEKRMKIRTLLPMRFRVGPNGTGKDLPAGEVVEVPIPLARELFSLGRAEEVIETTEPADGAALTGEPIAPADETKPKKEKGKK
jgi:hypothetical protein